MTWLCCEKMLALLLAFPLQLYFFIAFFPSSASVTICCILCLVLVTDFYIAPLTSQHLTTDAVQANPPAWIWMLFCNKLQTTVVF